MLDKDILNPLKWQKLQELRVPKNIKRDKVKGLNKCRRCSSWYVNILGSAQLRGADEPMTNFMECSECSFRFKV